MSPQPPQSLRSVRMFVQVPAQSNSPEFGHAQTPLWQRSAKPHMRSHRPQCRESRCRFEQVPLQQALPVAQTLPQLPQLF